MTVDEVAAPVAGVPFGYRVGPVVGRGTSSEIRLAVQLSTHRVVALKLLHTDMVGDAAWRRFEAERRALGELSHHSHIVTIIDAGMADDRPWIAMEYCSRGSFAGPGPGEIDAATAVAVLAAVASALETAHAAGIRHGDVKPANIMLTDSGAPALADFGLARLAAARSAGSSVRGYTPDHVPPELLDNDDRGLPGDVYSLGTTVWQLLAGRPPFRTDDDDAIALVMMRILRDPLPDLSRGDVPSWLVELLSAMTVKDPRLRPTAAEVSARVAGHEARAWPIVSPLSAAVVTGAGPGPASTDGLGASQTAHVPPRRSKGRIADAGDVSGVAVARGGRRRLLLGGAVAIALVALLVLAVLVMPRHRVLIGPAAADEPVPAATTPAAPPSTGLPTDTSVVVPPTSTSVPDSAGPVDEAEGGTGGGAPADGGGTGSGRTGGGSGTAGGTAAGGRGGGAAGSGGGAGSGSGGADNGGSTQGGTSPGSPAVAPDAQSAPRSTPIGGWRSFGGAGLSAGTGSLTISAPVNDYSALRGAFAPVDGCDYTVSFDAMTTPPSVSSPGYGYAVGVRSDLVSGVPHGWSMQYDWDGARNGFYHRVAVLPNDAYRATNGYLDSTSSSGWHHTVVRVQGSRATVTFDGQSVGSGSFGLGGGCGSGVVLRVWSASVHFRNVTLTNL